MTKATIDLTGLVPVTVEKAARIAREASRFEAGVMLREQESVINLKSMIGLLSMALSGRQTVELVCDGPDEEEALKAMLTVMQKP